MNTEIDFDSLLVDLGSQTRLLTVRDIAAIVDEHAAAVWRGDEDVSGGFYRWLASCWQSSPAPEPVDSPVAISVLAAGGVGIRWHEALTSFVGYVPGRQGARYVVSKTANPPRLHSGI